MQIVTYARTLCLSLSRSRSLSLSPSLPLFLYRSLSWSLFRSAPFTHAFTLVLWFRLTTFSLTLQIAHTKLKILDHSKPRTADIRLCQAFAAEMDKHYRWAEEDGLV